jgi:uncharacterized membrane protein YeaQ/YmgE (transglycosylase-associated protein family)
MKIIMGVTGALVYFVMTGMIVALFLKTGLSGLFRDIVVLSVGAVILWCFSYTGTWIAVAERNPKVFWRVFVMVDLVAATIGAVIAWTIIRICHWM